MTLWSGKMNFPTMKRARIYKKPGMYLSGPVLDPPRTYGAVADLTNVPSELLTSIPDIAFFPVFAEAAGR
jgi:hypothetical protein